MFLSHRTFNKQNITITERLFLQIQKVCGSKVCGLWNLSQGRDVYPATVCVSLIQPCCLLLLSLCRRAVVIRQFVPSSNFLLPPSADGPDGLPPIDGIVGLYSWYYQPCIHTCSAYTPFSSEGCYQPFILASTHDLLVLAMLVSCEACVGYQWALVKNLHIFRPSNSCPMLRSALFC